MRKVLAALALGAAIIASSSACTSSSTASSSGGGSTGGGKVVTAAGDDAHLATSTNICTLLPAATVAQITGTKFDTAKPDNTPSYELFSCEYTSSAVLGAELVVNVEGKDGSAGYGAETDAYTATGHTPTPIAGLGDKAFTTSIAGGAIGQVDALFGPELIKVGGLTSVTTDQAKQLIDDIHAKLAS